MKFKVGKRYTWTTYYSGGRPYDGLLAAIEYYPDGKPCGIFVTRQNDEWRIPLDAPTLALYRKEKHSK